MQVVCRQLGLQYLEYNTGAYFGRGSGPIWMDNVDCIGGESRLSDCNHRGWGIEDCGHGEDVGVTCYTGV